MKLTQEEKETRKKERQEEKRKIQEAKRIEAEKNQKPVQSIIINIEWKKSRTWGSNPSCEAEIRFKNGSFERSPIYKCSGCGYDKESTVIAEVFRDYLKYKLWKLNINENYCNNGSGTKTPEVPYGIICYRKDNIGFSGGIGTNCYYSISKFIGGQFERISSGKTFDVYKYTDLD